ncbi:TIGR03826 family flagellar region protein [Paenibacillus sp. JSM ZJ436]|uniref:TIGR03826 family flagellar region protein n=1 Tax=Paenibacillus sp. JSM ZJ436 TaxID=3376190 RepID=UPI0037B414BC
MNIGNCPRCGRLYALNLRELCGDCQKEIEQEYTRCAEYLREEKGATIHQVSDATGVSSKQITRFIREGRISLLDAPNMAYPCELCGVLIRENSMCNPCRNRLTKEIREATTHSTKDTNQNRSHEATYKAVDRYR